MELIPKYSQGKQTNPLRFQEFLALIDRAKLPHEQEGYLWLLFYTGARKSEVYETTTDDAQVTEHRFIIDIRRKKGGAQVPSIKLSRSWKGVGLLVALYETAQQRKPIRKRVYYQENKTTLSKLIRAHWLFPHIGSSTALRLVKAVLGSQFYPHFLRLNRLTEIGSDPDASIVRLKTFSGIQSIKTLESYLGTSEEEQEAALSWMERRMKNPAD